MSQEVGVRPNESGTAALVAGARYAKVVLSANRAPVRFVPRAAVGLVIEPEHPTYRDAFSPFSAARLRYPRPPIYLGDARVGLSTPHETNVLRVPIKLPGTEVVVPTEIAGYLPMIRRVAEYEALINPSFDRFYLHITVDRRTVPSGSTHRLPQFHVDGFIGPKFTGMPIGEHNYVMATAPPTEFCVQPFFVAHIDPARESVADEFDRQARPDNILRAIPGGLYLLDPYMVHRTPRIAVDVERVFVRICATPKRLDDDRNTITPWFGDQDYPPYVDLRETLSLYSGEVPWAMYGFSAGPARTP